jgi:hypothetical protein
LKPKHKLRRHVISVRINEATKKILAYNRDRLRKLTGRRWTNADLFEQVAGAINEVGAQN